jgi:hypothetical protein
MMSIDLNYFFIQNVLYTIIGLCYINQLGETGFEMRVICIGVFVV